MKKKYDKLWIYYFNANTNVFDGLLLFVSIIKRVLIHIMRERHINIFHSYTLWQDEYVN